MPDLSALGAALAVLGVGGFMLWFTIGTHRNIRKGNEILAWLQGGLPILGPRATVRWLGSSAVQLNIVQPRAPFREAEVVVVLEPRDIALLWAWARAHSRRDFLILRAQTRAPPTYEVEAGDPSGWTGGDRLQRLDADGWERTAWVDRNVGVAHSSGADVEAVHRSWKALDQLSAGVWRISVRLEPPNLEVHLRLPAAAGATAERLLRTFADLGSTVTSRS